MSYRIATYNIENMRRLFTKQGSIDPNMQDRADAVAKVILDQSPDILGLVEAADKTAHHQCFMESVGLKAAGYQLAKSAYKRRYQDLVFYYKGPFEIVSMDQDVDFYKQWIEDIDDDGIDEVCKFERKPLEARFRHIPTQTEFLIILLSIKSKGVFTVSDLIGHQHLALANRKRQHAQAKKLRIRINELLDTKPSLPIIMMGDFNDEPGLDNLERLLGVSALETIMGSVFDPKRILHNTLWHMKQDRQLAKDLWTTEYPDLIVQNSNMHRGWLDHILVTPNIRDRECGLKLICNSGRVAPKNEGSKKASDHYLIYCDVDID